MLVHNIFRLLDDVTMSLIVFLCVRVRVRVRFGLGWGVYKCFQENWHNCLDSLYPQFDWYNAYNERIRNEVGPLLLELDDKNAAYDWMVSKTKPITVQFTVGKSSSTSPTVGVVIGAVIGSVLVLMR